MTLRKLAELADLWSGEMIGLPCGETRLLLVNLDGEIRVYEDRCPHQGVPLSEGHLEGRVLTCRAHQWQYDVRCGAGINPLTARLRSFPVRVEDGSILVEVGEDVR